MGQFDEHKQKAVHKWRHFKEEREGVPIQDPTNERIVTEGWSTIIIKSFGIIRRPYLVTINSNVIVKLIRKQTVLIILLNS